MIDPDRIPEIPSTTALDEVHQRIGVDLGRGRDRTVVVSHTPPKRSDQPTTRVVSVPVDQADDDASAR